MSIAEKRRTFRALHQTGCFVIPNRGTSGPPAIHHRAGFQGAGDNPAPWVVLHSYGYSDGDVDLSMVLAHCRRNRRGRRCTGQCQFRELVIATIQTDGGECPGFASIPWSRRTRSRISPSHGSDLLWFRPRREAHAREPGSIDKRAGAMSF